MKPYIAFHADCPDGFSAAWIANKYFQGQCILLPQYHGQPSDFSFIPSDAVIYFFDFSPPRSTLIDLAARAEIHLFDHHKTAEISVGDLSYVTFDLTRSGCILAWDFFYPSVPRPAFLEYIQDGDLGQNLLESTKEIQAAIFSYPITLESWEALEWTNIDDLILLGKGVLVYNTCRAEEICKTTLRFIEIEGVSAPVVNTPIFYGECMDYLLRIYPEKPFALYYFDRGDGLRRWGIRSRQNDVDVSDIARNRGGGGHNWAAGWQEPIPTNKVYDSLLIRG